MEPESAEDFYARVQAATGPDGRLAVAVEEMPGWDIYPFEIDSLRMKPLQPARRRGAPARRRGPGGVLLRGPAQPGPGPSGSVWSNERWQLHLDTAHEAADRPQPRPARALRPADGPGPPRRRDGSADRRRLRRRSSRCPSVGRVQLAKYGDGGAHLHLFFFGRPARMLQLRGSPLLDWEENLPPVPLEVHRANAEHVAEHLLATVGGTGPGWL